MKVIFTFMFSIYYYLQNNRNGVHFDANLTILLSILWNRSWSWI